VKDGSGFLLVVAIQWLSQGIANISPTSMR